MYLFLQLQSEGHGGGWLDVQMKHSGGSSVGKVASCSARSLPAARGSTSSCAGITPTVISAAGAVLVSPLTRSGRPSGMHIVVAPKLAPTENLNISPHQGSKARRGAARRGPLNSRYSRSLSLPPPPRSRARTFALGAHRPITVKTHRPMCCHITARCGTSGR